ncbi:uncharacterized protein BDZ99DRAFT_56662 [Mytilinidion resinicola]|uniref:Uncharacterized protein n=1 Tax=Mytilinidion resinicola TaxID=574789 RepID=A0A6A6YI16_9PEZI|nr:uncharacterized protein BDZ99DRAFT_56662 [Mytilinidion resinicola]KAF2808482.1 hypothetical protein BDZ99DRAFT_56662 [Mytilinidion resinicola]
MKPSNRAGTPTMSASHSGSSSLVALLLLIQSLTLISILIVLAMGLVELKKPLVASEDLPTISKNIYSLATALTEQKGILTGFGTSMNPFNIQWTQ